MQFFHRYDRALYIQDCVLFSFTIHMLDCFVREAKDEVKPHISHSGGGEIQEVRKTITVDLAVVCQSHIITDSNGLLQVHE